MKCDDSNKIDGKQTGLVDKTVVPIRLMMLQCLVVSLMPLEN